MLDQVDSLLSSNTNSSLYGSDDNNEWFSTFMGDIYNNKGLIFGFGICVSTVIAFTYLYVLRIPGLLMLVIWSIIFSIEVLALAGAFMLMELAKEWKVDGRTDNEVKGMEILSYIVLFLAFLYACLMVVLRKRVQLAISVVKQAARSLASMPVLIFMPVFQTVFLCIFLVPWCIYVLYLASSGDISNATGSYITGLGTSVEYQYREFTFDQNTKFAFLYMLFIYFWTSEFIVAVGQLIIALSIVAWYFNRDKKSVNNKTAIWSAKTITRYHLGTAAFGSLIIAIIKTIRAVIAYFQNKAKKSGNKLAQYVLCVLQCCMWCLEKFMKFLNKNAYIQTAIYGQSFCPAAKRAFFLLLRNVLRVAAVTMVSTFILLLGKVIIIFLLCIITIIHFFLFLYLL
jgi:choline transporter-like protein 2/4/5